MMLIKTPTPYYDKYGFRIFFTDKVKYKDNIYVIVEKDGLTYLVNDDTSIWFKQFESENIEIIEG